MYMCYYGVNMDSIRFKKNAEVLFMNLFYLTDEYGQSAYNEFCEEMDIYPGNDESKEGFVDSYESDDLDSTGFEVLIADYINHHEFDDYIIFMYDDDILGVMPDVPADEEEAKRFPTQKRVQEILSKYLNPLLEEPAVIDWYDIHE